MRGLTAKQKKLLDKWYKENKSKTHIGILFDLGKCEAFSLELLERLEEINDTEILYQAINSYIADKVMKK